MINKLFLCFYLRKFDTISEEHFFCFKQSGAHKLKKRFLQGRQCQQPKRIVNHNHLEVSLHDFELQLTIE